MPTFELPGNFTGSYVPYRHATGYLAKGTIFREGKPVEIFEAHGRTLPDTGKAARAKARDLCQRRRATKRKK